MSKQKLSKATNAKKFHFTLTQSGSTFTKSFNAVSIEDATLSLLRDLAIVAAASRAKGKKAPLSARSPFQVVAIDEVGNVVIDTTFAGNILLSGDGANFTGARFVRSLAGMKRILHDVRIAQTANDPEVIFAAIEADKLARKNHKTLPTTLPSLAG